MPVHLRPSATIAADALLPGDPGRAMMLAQELTEQPRMSNHSRGLWGYHGATLDGRELTIQSTGIGAPSAAIVLEELAEMGVRRAIRLGTCAALRPGLGTGDVLVVTAALAADGLGRELGGADPIEPDAELTAALRRAAGDAVPGAIIASSDRWAAGDPDRARQLAGGGAVACDMPTAALFAVGARLGVATGCLLAVAAAADGARAGDDELERAARRIGRIAAEALA